MIAVVRGARVGLIVGGVAGLMLTPPFALSFFPAYGRSSGEHRPGWLENLHEPLSDLGVFGTDWVATYTRYGKAYGVALLIVTVSLAVVVNNRSHKGRRETRAWRTIVAGLALTTVGTFGDYAFHQDGWSNWGFGLELLGLFVIAVGTPLLGWALRREADVSKVMAIGAGAIGPASVVVGGGLVGHIPSGTASLLLIVAIVIGVTGLPDNTRSAMIRASATKPRRQQQPPKWTWHRPAEPRDQVETSRVGDVELRAFVPPGSLTASTRSRPPAS